MCSNSDEANINFSSISGKQSEPHDEGSSCNPWLALLETSVQFRAAWQVVKMVMLIPFPEFSYYIYDWTAWLPNCRPNGYRNYRPTLYNIGDR